MAFYFDSSAKRMKADFFLHVFMGIISIFVFRQQRHIRKRSNLLIYLNSRLCYLIIFLFYKTWFVVTDLFSRAMSCCRIQMLVLHLSGRCLISALPYLCRNQFSRCVLYWQAVDDMPVNVVEFNQHPLDIELLVW